MRDYETNETGESECRPSRCQRRGGSGRERTGSIRMQLTHEQTLAWITENRAWRRARKTKPIWARPVLPEEVGREYQTADRAVERAQIGFWLCVGVVEEPWFQTLEAIEAKYIPGEKRLREFAFDDTPTNYQRFLPRTSAAKWAAQVQGPQIDGFEIIPSYDVDQPLHSPAGGYVVRGDAEDPYAADLDDVWLVQREIFESTYEIID